MQAKELKEYICEDVERIEEVLSFYEFHDFWLTSDEVRCAPPGSDNRTAVSIKTTEPFYASCYNSLNPFHGDIFSLIEDMTDKSFKVIIKEIHGVLGLKNDYKKQKDKVDLLSDIRKYRKKNGKRIIVNEKFEKDKLDEFIMLPHINILKEHISPQVCKQFDVCYDPKKDRIVFPHYDWIEHDKIVGITGRTTLDKDLAKELNVPKYWNYIKGYKKTSNLFGYNNAIDGIAKNNMIIIFEAEKSVMKQFTIEKGMGYSVSVGGHEISDTQVEFIIKNTDPDTEVVVAFDKDVMYMEDDDGNLIGEDQLIDTCKRFSNFRKTSYVFDKYNVLGEKDSPIDIGMKVWNILLKYRKRV